MPVRGRSSSGGRGASVGGGVSSEGSRVAVAGGVPAGASFAGARGSDEGGVFAGGSRVATAGGVGAGASFAGGRGFEGGGGVLSLFGGDAGGGVPDVTGGEVTISTSTVFARIRAVRPVDDGAGSTVHNSPNSRTCSTKEISPAHPSRRRRRMLGRFQKAPSGSTHIRAQVREPTYPPPGRQPFNGWNVPRVTRRRP
ncbi:hypothetical protein KH5H1_07600 [Corallococcus caeni]|nr:hypothetical protein KH5H1_07600 [Corallococcus sp. KH5-1]